MPALAHSVSLKSIAAVLGGGRFSPAALVEIEILTRDGSTILTRDGSTVIGRAN